MLYILFVKSQAETEIISSKKYYNSKKQSLGSEFIQELDLVFNRIIQNPFQFPKYEDFEIK